MEVTTSPILWQNADQTVTLIDIPRSIAAAQGIEELPCRDILLSSAAIQSPFSTNEPKSKKARSKVKANTIDEGLQHEYDRVLQHALEDIRTHYRGLWCLGRSFIGGSTNSPPKKRKQSDSVDEPSKSTLSPSEVEDSDPRLAPRTAQNILSLHQHTNTLCPDCYGSDERFYCNPSALRIELNDVGSSNSHRNTQGSHYIPPQSSFYLGDCMESRAFHACIRNQAQAHETRRHFDFVLLDPPWPNSSVKRTRKTPGSSYATISTLNGVSELLISTDLDMLMDDTCLVGFWITNRQSVRKLLLGQNGIFDTWSLQLEEEWIWLKTTPHGLPVTPIDACWRKPYEVLLLGRRHRKGSPRHSNASSVPKRRVIVGVPDLHSRKPCLKVLVEALLPSGSDRRALEVFARHLVAGWCSWGNECIKFNLSSNWQKVD